MAEYDVFLLDHQFTRLAYLQNYHSLHFVKTCNARGAFEIAFSVLDSTLLAVDRIVEIWRRTTGVPPLRVFSGLLRKWPEETDSDGTHTITLVGSDWNDLLERRVVAYQANTPQADKNGPADDLMKAVVRENLGTLAQTGRDLSGYGFGVQADASAGPIVSKAMEWTSVLSALKKLSEEAAGETPGINTDEVFFDVVHIGKDALEFQTWVGQRGLDRTSGAGVCYFGLEHGNLVTPKLTHDHSKEKNYVYVGGKGKGEKLVIKEVENSDLIGASTWNRCEIYERAPSDLADGTLQSVGDGVLAENAPILGIKGSLLDTKATRMGRDWNFGDRVLVKYGDKYLSVVIAMLDLTLDEKGREKIKVVLDASTGKQGWDNETASLLRLIKSLRRKVDEPPEGGGFFMDFTGTQFDTVDKCHRAALRFSDVDSPFLTRITWGTVTGTWSHTAGRGWRPFCSSANAGPSIVFPLDQGQEWQIEMAIDYRLVSLSTQSHSELSYLTNSGNIGAIGVMTATNAAEKQVHMVLYTADGDTTFTTRYTGSNHPPDGVHTIKFRNKNGVIGIWDEDDSSWHNYTSRAASSGSHSAALGGISLRRIDAALDEMYLASLKVWYTDRGE